MRLHTLLGRCVAHMRSRAAAARPGFAPAGEAIGGALAAQPPGSTQQAKVLALMLSDWV